MEFRIRNAFGNLKEEYPELFEKFKIKQEKFDYGYLDYVICLYDFRDLDLLANIVKHDLLMQMENRLIIIYDDYME